MHIHSNYADKICSLIAQGDCNSILDSKEAKIAGFSWSEIGLGYFISNIVIITFYPDLYPYLAVLNCFSLPYTIWSVLYQKVIAKQWCPLCLIVQLILWLLFVFNIFAKNIIIPDYNLRNIILIILIYTLFIILSNIIKKVATDLKDKESISQELNSIKLDKDVFDLLIKKKNRYEITKSDSSITLGNTESDNLITIITNPHCNPCAQLHKKIKESLRQNKCCIQYILTSFSSHLEESNKLIIAMYKKMEQDDFLDFLDEWYDYGRFNIDKIIQKYPFEYNIDIDHELLKHKKWINKVKIRSTPVVLFNGYEIPSNIYKIEDIEKVHSL